MNPYVSSTWYEHSWHEINTVLISLTAALEMEMEEYQRFQTMISK